MTQFGRIGFVVLIYLLMVFPGMGMAQVPEWLYTVRPGDNIWTITDRYLVSMRYWQDLQRINQISDPYRLRPGQRLRVPIEWLAIQPVPVEVVSVSGEVVVEVWHEGGAERPLAAGDRLHAGDQLRTGEEGNAALQFADGSRLSVRAGSAVTLDTVSAYGDSGMTDTRVRLQSGRLDTRAREAQGPATRFQIQTPAAVSAVRGTEYRVGVADEGERAITEVLTGRVAVAGAGVDRLVAGGFGTVTLQGRPPEQPTPLLEPPDLAAADTKLDRIPFLVVWLPLSGATGYRAQVSADPSFEVVLADGLTTAPRLLGPDLPDGRYWLRVRGIDPARIEGQSAVLGLELDARPVPPILVTPGPDATIRDPAPELAWSRPEGIGSYRVQIARDLAFQDLVGDMNGARGGSARPAQPLDPGSYHWRVGSIAADGEQGPFSDPQQFTFRPIPPSPELEAPEVENEELVLRWSAGEPGQQYHLQLARAAGFGSPVVDTQLTEPSFALTGFEPGVYYVRLATVDVDGYEGPFGPPQQITVPVGTTLPWMLMILFGVLML